MGLQERNERLFYRVLHENTQELLPIIDLPTVGAFCESYGLMFRAAPRGLYISLKDKGAHVSHVRFDRAANARFIDLSTINCSDHLLKGPKSCFSCKACRVTNDMHVPSTVAWP